VLEILHLDSERVLALRIGGKIRDEDMRLMIETAQMKIAALGAKDRLRVYVEVEPLHGIELEALWRDLKFGFSHLREFERKAVVSDRAWMARMAKIVGPLFPGIEVRHFATADRAAAREWVCGD